MKALLEALAFTLYSVVEERIIELFMIDPREIETGPVFRAEVESHRSSVQRKRPRARAAL